MPWGFILLISLAIALAITFLLVLAAFAYERWRRKKEGYVPMAQTYPSHGQASNIDRVPPERLFGTLNQQRGGNAPMI